MVAFWRELLDGHMLAELFPQAEHLPGAVRLAMHLHGAGIPQAVASSSGTFKIKLKITRHEEEIFLPPTG